MIFTDEGIKLARTVVRVPELEKWNREALAAVRSTPHDLYAPKETEVAFREEVDVEKLPEPAPNIARQLYLRADDFERHGHPRGCPKCDYFLKYGNWGTKPHSTICRERIIVELA